MACPTALYLAECYVYQYQRTGILYISYATRGMWGGGYRLTGGGTDGVHFGVFDTIPIRARAYNDCVRIPVLPKTRSSGGPGYPLIGRVLGAYRSAHT